MRFLLVGLLVLGGCGDDINGGGTGTGGSAGAAGNGGSAGVAGAGGSGGVDAAATGCGLVTCASANANCGPIGDGCGNMIDCGTCTPPTTCGGGGVPSQCGGNQGCVSRTCAQLGANCGPAADGCGNLLQCGTCPTGQTCGAGGPNICGAGSSSPDGGSTSCVPQTCAQLGYNCGPAGDGCGGTLNCGTCSTGTCGGAGVPGQCGSPICTPRTCAQAGANCGAVGDGCGGIIQCGGCAAPNICGGGGTPNVCGNNTQGGTSNCPNGGSTTITGTVVAGTDPARGFGQPDPVYNAYVYVPSGPIQPITTGATCDQCTMSQAAIVSAVTGIDGTFTLVNPPTGANVPVVIQLGKWRRVLSVNVTACTNNPLTTAQTHLPRNRSEGNIPRFAIDTGDVDVLECVLRKMGIEDAEFTNPSIAGGVPTSAGRVHLYQANPLINPNAAGGAIIDTSTPTEDQLITSQTVMNSYDAVLFSCEGGQDDEVAADQQRVIDYANLGGRIFATHFSYTWLYNDVPFSNTAAWQVNQGNFNSVTGIIDQSFPKGTALAQWLQLVGASTTLGQIPVNVVRHDFNSVVAPSQRWMYTQGSGNFPIHYTFNTPVGAAPANQCGRVVFSDFHVENSNGAFDSIFPTECNANAPLTPQEKLLEFMLFDLTSCVTPDVPTCTPLSCAQQGFNCGQEGDGCGNVINCGTCPSGQICGGGGTPGVCSGGCTPRTCAQQNINCGPAGDGCGGLLQCGSCPTGQTCGGGGVPGQCGSGPSCTPQTCAQQNLNCGPAGDGCGNVIQCGSCPTGQTCGGGGVPGQCGAPNCTPLTCAQVGAQCGIIGNGCGGTLDCGTCTPPQTCGGGGVANHCGLIP